MSGNAELAAGEIAATLRKREIVPRVVNMAKCKAAMLTPGSTFIICTSTYGDGDVPDDAQPFFAELQSTAPDLTGVTYGVAGLGDTLYAATFCFGSKRFDELLGALGATRIGERMQHDASSGAFADEAAAEWLRRWLTALEAATAEPV